MISISENKILLNGLLSAFILIAGALAGMLVGSKYGLYITVIFIILSIGIIVSKDPIKNLILLIILIFPLAPFHVGFDLGRTLPVLKVHRILIFVIYILWFVDYVFRGKKGNFKILAKEYPLWPITGYIGLILLTITIINGSGLNGQFYVISFLVENCLLAFFVYAYFKDEAGQRDLLKILCISGILVAVGGCIEFIIGFNWYSLLPVFREEMDFSLIQQTRLDANRIKGAFTHSINYGATLAIISSCFIPFLISTKKKLLKVSCIASVALLLVSCYLTMSRGPIAIFIFIMLFVLLWKGKRWLLILSIVLTVMYMQPYFLNGVRDNIAILFHDTVYSSTTSIGRSSSVRIEQVNIGLGLIKQKPFFGYPYKSLFMHLRDTIDNYYLKYSLDFGIVGMAALLTLMLVIVRNTLVVVNCGKTEFQKLYGTAYLGVIGGIFLLWLTVSLDDNLYWFWIMCGIAMRMRVSSGLNPSLGRTHL